MIIIATIVAVLGLRIFQKWNITDKPGRDVATRKSVPTIQGIFLYIAVVVMLILLFPHIVYKSQVWPLIAGA